jgi:hypothetical protein
VIAIVKASSFGDELVNRQEHFSREARAPTAGKTKKLSQLHWSAKMIRV